MYIRILYSSLHRRMTTATNHFFMHMNLMNDAFNLRITVMFNGIKSEKMQILGSLKDMGPLHKTQQGIIIT